MGVRYLVGREYGDEKYPEEAVLFCSVTDWAFGPVFHGGEEAGAFLEWVAKGGFQDPRTYTDKELEDLVSRFRDERDRIPSDTGREG